MAGSSKKKKIYDKKLKLFFLKKKQKEKETKARNGSLFESVSRIWASRIWWAIESCAIAIFEPRTEQNSYPTPPPTVLVGSPPPFIDNCLPDGLMSILHCYSSSCMFLGGSARLQLRLARNWINTRNFGLQFTALLKHSTSDI